MGNPAWTEDELVLACALVAKNGWRMLSAQSPQLHELSELLRALPVHRPERRSLPDFRSVGSVRRKTEDIRTCHPSYPRTPTKGGAPTKRVVSAFLSRETEMLQAAQVIATGITSGDLINIPEQPDEADTDGTIAVEGRLLTRWAIYRERDPKLRRRKIAQARKLSQPLQCTVCAFHFERAYGELGKDYIEVHHVLPLHISGPRETRLEDLAFLCSNCHRMCHTGHRGASWRTPDDVRVEMVKAAESARQA
ncbi:HNH endonuclease [Streptomyces sp. NPDC051994]|uniref:HNH endonuclease n=1 Tax=unclassified Streptomyces TaxID=2593676 RepID=UPI00343238CD